MKRLASLRASSWVFLLILPALPFAGAWWKVKTPFRPPTGAGYATDAIGERANVGALSYYLQKQTTPNVTSVFYTVPEFDGKYLPEVRQGKRHLVQWIYRLEYNRQAQTLTKLLFNSNPPAEEPTKIWIWSHVSEEAIHKVAAPIRAMKTTFQQAAYKGGNLPELKKYGAVLEEVK